MRLKTFTALAAGFLVVTACSADTTGGGTGTLAVRLTDAPFPFSEVARVDVHIVRVDAQRAEPSEDDAEDPDDMGGWTTISEPDALINLLDLAGGVTTNLGEATLPTGTYRGFRIIIDPSLSSVTLNDGSTPEVKWPSAAQTGIKVKLDEPVTLDADGSVLILDFDVGRSFVLRGNDIRNNGLLFKPVVRGTAVDITGSASGTVRGDDAEGPVIAGATVEVLKDGVLIDDADEANVVATTSTDENGVFRFGFLLPGNYELRVTPPAGSVYKPALLSSGLTIETDEETSGILVILGR